MDQRPSSRGFGANAPGGGIPRAPGGGILGGGPAAPGTASGNAQWAPGTAYKRTGTASGRPGMQGGPVRTGAPELQVENRPITQHGVVGMRTATAAGLGGRKVLDKNYFLNELRQKRLEIAAVTQKMRVRHGSRRACAALDLRVPRSSLPLPAPPTTHARGPACAAQDELEAVTKRQAQYKSMDKRCAELIKEVKLNQEQLANYNTVLDKVRACGGQPAAAGG